MSCWNSKSRYPSLFAPEPGDRISNYPPPASPLAMLKWARTNLPSHREEPEPGAHTRTPTPRAGSADAEAQRVDASRPPLPVSSELLPQTNELVPRNDAEEPAEGFTTAVTLVVPSGIEAPGFSAIPVTSDSNDHSDIKKSIYFSAHELIPPEESSWDVPNFHPETVDKRSPRSPPAKHESPEIKSKKAEVESASLQLSNARTESTARHNAITSRRAGLEAKRAQLEERKRSFETFLGDCTRKLERSNAKLAKEAEARKEKEEEIRTLGERIELLGRRKSNLEKKARGMKVWREMIWDALEVLFGLAGTGSGSRLEVNADQANRFHLTPISRDSDPTIDDLVHSYRRMQIQSTESRTRLSTLVSTAQQLVDHFALQKAEAESSRSADLLQSTHLQSTQSSLRSQVTEYQVRLESDARRHRDLRLHILEIQESIFRFLERAEDTIDRRARRILGPEHVLHVDSEMIVAGDVEVEMDGARLQEIRARDRVHTKQLLADLEALKRVWNELEVLVVHIEKSQGEQKRKRDPSRQRTVGRRGES